MKPSIQEAASFEGIASRLVAKIEAVPAAVWILGLPLIVVFTTTSTINQAGYIDPNYYASYIHDFDQAANQYGQRYQSERIAFMVVDMLLLHLLGVEAGYLAARWLMLAVATASVYAIARRFYGTSVAIFAASWICFIPWLGRSLWWTHNDGFATTYLLAAIALLLVPARGRIFWHALAGVVWMLAINAQALLLAVGGLFLVPWAIVNARQGLIWLARHAGAVLLGMVCCYTALALIYAALVPENYTILGSATLGMSRWSISGGAANWFTSMDLFFERGLWIPLILPIFLLIGMSVWLVDRRPRAALAEDALPSFLWYGALVAVLCLGLHFGLSVGLLSLFYYTIYLLPACMLVLIGVAGRAKLINPTQVSAVLLILSILLVVIWIIQVQFSDMIRLSRMETGMIVLALTIAAMVGIAIRLDLAVAAMTAITFFTVTEFGNGTYNIRNARAEAAQLEWDVYRGAIAFQKWVGDVAPVVRDVRFWYTGVGESKGLISVQSMFNFSYSLLTKHPYPEITPEVKEAILAREFICLLALDDAGLAVGLASIEAQGIAFEEVARFAHDGEVWDFRSVMIRLPKQP